MATGLAHKTKGTETSSFGTNGRINHDSSKFYNSKIYEGISNNSILEIKDNSLPQELLNQVILGNSEKMSLIPDNSIHLMIT